MMRRAAATTTSLSASRTISLPAAAAEGGYLFCCQTRGFRLLLINNNRQLQIGSSSSRLLSFSGRRASPLAVPMMMSVRFSSSSSSTGSSSPHNVPPPTGNEDGGGGAGGTGVSWFRIFLYGFTIVSIIGCAYAYYLITQFSANLDSLANLFESVTVTMHPATAFNPKTATNLGVGLIVDKRHLVFVDKSSEFPFAIEGHSVEQKFNVSGERTAEMQSVEVSKQRYVTMSELEEAADRLSADKKMLDSVRSQQQQQSKASPQKMLEGGNRNEENEGKKKQKGGGHEDEQQHTNFGIVIVKLKEELVLKDTAVQEKLPLEMRLLLADLMDGPVDAARK